MTSATPNHLLPVVCACTLAASVALAPADVSVIATGSANGNIGGSNPTSKTIGGIVVQTGDAIVFGYSANRPDSQLAATVELTEAGNPANVIAALDQVGVFGSGGNESTGIFWLPDLTGGVYDVVLSYTFTDQTSASTGAGYALLRPATGGTIVLQSPTSAIADGDGLADMQLDYLGLSAGGVLFETVSANDELAATAGDSVVYSAGAGDRRSGWHSAVGADGDLGRVYSVDFGGTADLAVAAGACFAEVASDTSFILASGQDSSVVPSESAVGVEWATTAAGADSVIITADDPSVTPPAAPLPLSGSGDLAVDYPSMPALVSVTLEVLDTGAAVVDSKALLLTKWEFAAVTADFEGLTPDPGNFVTGDVGDGLTSDGTGAEVIAVSGAGSTGSVGARFLDDSEFDPNQTRFENLLTAVDNQVSGFVFRWVVRVDSSAGGSLRLGTTNLNSRLLRSSFIVPLEMLPTGDGEFHVVELVMNNTPGTLLYDHGTAAGLKIGPHKADLFIDGDRVKGLSVSGYPGPDFVDSAGFVTFNAGTMDVTIDEFTLTALDAGATTPIVGAGFSDTYGETAGAGGRFVFNFHYPAGAVDIYESADMESWLPAPGGENLPGGAYAVEDFLSGPVPNFYIAVPHGQPFPQP